MNTIFDPENRRFQGIIKQVPRYSFVKLQLGYSGILENAIQNSPISPIQVKGVPQHSPLNYANQFGPNPDFSQ